MARPPFPAAYAAVLEAAGFSRDPIAAASASDAWRRPARAPWVIEARPSGDGASHLDVGLTLPGPGAAALLGPVHRALSPSALAAALADITASLEALADAAERLRCPDCNGLEAIREGEGGPFLACGQPRRGRRPFDGATRRCRRDLVMAALVVHADPGDRRGR
jgi:hypothetical protein